MGSKIKCLLAFFAANCIAISPTTASNEKIAGNVSDAMSERTISSEEGGVDELNSAARDLLHRARYPEAAAIFEAALEASPNNHASLVGIAHAYVEMGRIADALEALDLAIKEIAEAQLRPAVEAERRLAIGRGLTRAGRHDAAHDQLAAAVSRAQDARELALGVRIYTAHAIAYTQQRRFRQADISFAAANELMNRLDDDPALPTLRRDFVIAAVDRELEQGDVGNASSLLGEFLDSGVEIDSLNIARISLRLGRALKAEGELEEAAGLIELAAEVFAELLGPRHPDTWAAEQESRALGSAI